MDIKEDEIKEINKLGKLNGDEVKLVTLKGGFHIGIGKKSEDSKKDTILAVGSHPALVSYQISKKYDNFEQILNKSEGEVAAQVIDYSKNLSSLQKNILGLDIYAVKSNDKVGFKVTKHNFEIFSIEASQNGQDLLLQKTEKNPERMGNINKSDLSKSLEKAIKEFAQENELNIKKNF